MAYTIVNLVAFLIGTAFLYNGYRRARLGRESMVLFSLFTGIGLGLMVVAVFPGILTLFARVIGLEQDLRARAVLIISNFTLFIVIGYLANRVGQLQQHVSRLNEELSLLKNEVEEENEAGRDDE